MICIHVFDNALFSSFILCGLVHYDPKNRSMTQILVIRNTRKAKFGFVDINFGR